jgi:hypothetical protein
MSRPLMTRSFLVRSRFKHNELLHLLDIRQRPAFVKERCCRAVRPKPDEKPKVPLGPVTCRLGLVGIGLSTCIYSWRGESSCF